MNRGIFIIGVVSIFVTLGNIFVSGIFNVLTCFDTCPSLASMIANSPLSALLYVVFLIPALTLILIAWIWELRELRQAQAMGLLAFAATFPLIALAAIFVGAVLAAVSQGIPPLEFTPLHLWDGEFALALWPLLVSIIAFARRQRAPRAPGQRMKQACPSI